MAERYKQKEFVVIYKSREHYEILGFVRAESPEEAVEKAKRDLNYDARHYGVGRAMVFEIRNGGEISLDKK